MINDWKQLRKLSHSSIFLENGRCFNEIDDLEDMEA